jgi:S1-C subfamily serine protease
VLGLDSSTDAAVLKINLAGPTLRALPLVPSDEGRPWRSSVMVKLARSVQDQAVEGGFARSAGKTMPSRPRMVAAAKAT